MNALRGAQEAEREYYFTTVLSLDVLSNSQNSVIEKCKQICREMLIISFTGRVNKYTTIKVVRRRALRKGTSVQRT